MKEWLTRLATVALGILITLIGAYALKIKQLPDTQPWHVPSLDESHLASKGIGSFSDYLAHENRLFVKLGGHIAKLNNQEAWNRFNPTSPANPLTYQHNLNRTHIWPVENPIGGALLTHGLSDSPYSLNALAYQLASSGYYVINLRIPGHGTTPGNLSTITLDDFRLSYRLAMEHLQDIIGNDKPILAAGYSNGAALAVDYNLSALANNKRMADGLFLISPAFQVNGAARFAGYLKHLAALPGLEKVAWNSILPEYDPYKYNSFPIAAGEQIFQLTEDITANFQQLNVADHLYRFPQTLVIQSVVDATIAPQSVVDRFLTHLPENKAELVLFDVNRLQQLEVFIAQKHRPFLRAIEQQKNLTFDFTLISNRSNTDRQVEARHRHRSNNTWTTTPLPYRWPEDVYSLSHVAVPIAANDPIYGEADSQSATNAGLPLLGQLSARGERGTFVVPMDQLQRLRYNPFYGYIEMRLDEFLTQLSVEP